MVRAYQACLTFAAKEDAPSVAKTCAETVLASLGFPFRCEEASTPSSQTFGVSLPLKCPPMRLGQSSKVSR